jgi:hypothetical protein
MKLSLFWKLLEKNFLELSRGIKVGGSHQITLFFVLFVCRTSNSKHSHEHCHSSTRSGSTRGLCFPGACSAREPLRVLITRGFQISNGGLLVYANHFLTHRPTPHGTQAEINQLLSLIINTFVSKHGCLVFPVSRVGRPPGSPPYISRNRSLELA